MQMKHSRCRQHGLDAPNEHKPLQRDLTGQTTYFSSHLDRIRLTRSNTSPWGAPERRTPRRRGAAAHGRTGRAQLARRSSRLLGRGGVAGGA